MLSCDCGFDRLGKGMSGVVLRQPQGLSKLFLSHFRCRDQSFQLHAACGESPSLVEDHALDFAKCIQEDAALEDNASSCGCADADEICQRDGDHQSAHV